MPEPFAGPGASPAGPGSPGSISLEENAARPYERRLDPWASLARGVLRVRSRTTFDAPGVALWAFGETEVRFENDTKNHHICVTLRFGAGRECDR